MINLSTREDKINKYVQKYNENKYNTTYAAKLANHTINYIMSGGDEKIASTDFHNKSDILKFLAIHFPDKNKTKNKYAIITYGPPGSGKTFAKRVGTIMLNNKYHENIDPNDFVDIDKDSISYQSTIYYPSKYIDSIPDDKKINNNKINCKDLLMIIKQMHKDLDKNILFDNENETVQNIFSETQYIYNKCRSNVQLVYELMYYLSMTLGANFILEVADSEPAPLIYRIKKLLQNKYKIIIVYPKVSSVQTLIRNNIGRGINEWRFTPVTMINNIYKKSIYGSDKIYNFLSSLNDANAMYVEYDSEFLNSDTYSIINFSTDEFILDNMKSDIIRTL